MKTTGAVITEIIEALDSKRGQWVRLADLAQRIGAGREEMTEALTDLMEDESFQVEPQPFGHLVTAEDKALGIVIGGEQRHLICWG